jgi:hypothetical protein
VVVSRTLDAEAAVECGAVGRGRRMVEPDGDDIDVGMDAIRRDRAATVAIGVHRRTYARTKPRSRANQVGIVMVT